VPDSKKDQTPKTYKNEELLSKFNAAIAVPHSWFIHFYILSIASSIFWGYQILTGGRVFEALAANARPRPVGQTMSIEQVILTWFLVLVQGFRRLYEQAFVMRPGNSSMNLLLYGIAVLYYLMVGIAVWTEGIRKF
jgi:3-oxo-5-alpha-steroid 4-dehydrogenase 3